MKFNIKVRNLGLRHIEMTSNSMQRFTITRNKFTLDEIWLVQHYPIFTFGVSEKICNWCIPKSIPIVFSNRGGKTTYHGPGQLLIYFLLDLVRRGMNVGQLIVLMQNVVLYTLKCLSIDAYVLNTFPGIYVNKKKICSFGLRIKKGCSFYGMALNVDMNLSPFNYINPCGNDIKMTQVIDIKPNLNFKIVQLVLINSIKKYFL
ncbi:MAG: lipoyl(octanoyl) transferase LipB [Buchnera aphidicola (Meitanaphis microgallis)]